MLYLPTKHVFENFGVGTCPVAPTPGCSPAVASVVRECAVHRRFRTKRWVGEFLFWTNASDWTVVQRLKSYSIDERQQIVLIWQKSIERAPLAQGVMT